MSEKEQRYQGRYLTPKRWVDYAHRKLEQCFGSDWKERYVVYDCCSGTGNLTKDYEFKNLFCSTLIPEELEYSKQFNRSAHKFVFDFLNDPLSSMDDTLLLHFLNNEPMIWFINPPYANSYNGKTNNETKSGIANTAINQEMKLNKLGGSCQNLYTQFIYRILKIKREYGLTNCHICIFCPILFLTGTSFQPLRELFLSEFTFIHGTQFNALEFEGCSGEWSIMLSLWKSGASENLNEFEFSVCDVTENGITPIKTHIVYNLPNKNKAASEWIKEPVKNLKTHDYVNLSSGIAVSLKNTKGNIFEPHLGYMFNVGNNIEQNAQSVALLSSCFSNGHGVGINESNFLRCASLFTARRYVKKTWFNSQAEYNIPNTEHEKWNTFEANALVGCLFNSKSSQTALRNVLYKENIYNIPNHWFFMSLTDIKELALEYNDHECLESLKSETEERFMFTLLEKHRPFMSETATSILNLACELVRQSFQKRYEFDALHKEYQIHNWDCGYYQLKELWRFCFKDKFDDFYQQMKVFAEEMEPLIYEVGFLK